nr:hypothetical protein [Sphingomonas sp. Y57]
MEHSQTQILSRARPVRVAYLVDLDAPSHDVLDAIFATSFGMWGGRFSLIIPCRNGHPVEAYLPWLAAFDADIIYSYIELDDERQFAVHETYYPHALIVHHQSRADRPDYRPQFPFAPLSVTTLIPFAGAPAWTDGSRGTQILGAMGTLADNRFLLDSFGLASSFVRNAVRGPLAESASILLAIADGELEPRRQYVQGAESTIATVPDILRRMAEQKRLTGVSRLSALMTPRLDARSTSWDDSFNIVVAESVEDRMLYWNARALTASWRDGHEVDLCVARAQFDDPDFVDALRLYLNARNFVNPNGSSGPYRATLRSISVPEADLAALATSLPGKGCWISFNHEAVVSIEQCVPTKSSLATARFIESDSGFRTSGSWSDTVTSSDTIRLATPQPTHFQFAGNQPLDPSSGVWAIDLDIERSLDHSPFDGTRHRWVLPRRLRVARSFMAPYRLCDPNNASAMPRVARGGLLSMLAVANLQLPEITLPSDEIAIADGLMRGRDWPPASRFDQRASHAQACYAATRSSAGRQFWGAYQLLGGLDAARRFLFHEFWIQQLDRFGATGRRGEGRADQVQQQLRRRIGERSLDLGQADQLQTLANITLQAADEERATAKPISWTRFATSFEELIAADQAGLPEDLRGDADMLFWQRDGLARYVEDLCQRGVLHQGYEHKCRKCLHRSWVGIDALASMLTCEVCADAQPAPVDRSWDFKLNGFLREALQRHGIGPLFWVLSRHQRHNRHSLWFEGPLDIYFDKDSFDANRRATDVDLTMIDNGIVKMCEAKQSERHFVEPAKMAETFIRLRPDVALIAVMEADSPAIQQKFETFSKALEGAGIRPELMTLDPALDYETGPYF